MNTLQWLILLVAGILIRTTSLTAQVSNGVVVPLEWINFSPYTQPGQNPNMMPQIPEAQIIALLDTLTPRVKGIRTFGTENGLEKIPYLAKQRGLKVIMGIWLGSDLSSNDRQIANGIQIAEQGYADRIIVGSEVLLRNELDPSAIVGYINQVKQACPGIPVSYADVASVLLNNPAIIGACDFVAPNIYPFWERIAIECSMQHFHQTYQSLVSVAGGKEIFISETGWKTLGPMLGEAVPSLDNAVRYIRELLSWSKAFQVDVNIFSAFDEPWKLPDDDGWGIFTSSGVLKPGMDSIFIPVMEIDSSWICSKVMNNSRDTLNIDYVPDPGSFENLEGHINFLKPCNFRISAYIKVAGNWWIKPSLAQSTVIIRCNGKWTLDFTTGGIDEQATDLCLFLIPEGYSPPVCLGCSILPREIYDHAIAVKNITRCPLPHDPVTVVPAEICAGSSSVLSVEGGISYLWSTGDTSASVQVSPSVTTGYHVVVTKPSGCVETRKGTVTLLPFQECASTLEIPLSKGWNIFSVNNMPLDPDMKILFQPLISNGNLIKIQDETGNSMEDFGVFGGWTNGIGNIALTEGYKVKVTGDCKFILTGVPVLFPFEIPLKAGWNIIGYPHLSEANAQAVVRQLIDRSTLIKVQDETGNSIEDWGFFGGWQNNIGTFKPGEGYKIKVTADETLTIYPSYP